MNTSLKKEPSTKHGIFMFVFLVFAYILFAANWVGGSNLSKQITSYYFEGKEVSSVVSEVINYTITTARIFANLLAAYILIKTSPKKATIIAMSLLCFSFIAVLMPSYILYTISRMIMALGGSMIMVYVNTYVAKFVPKEKKIISSAYITASYNIGAVLVAVLFFFFKSTFIADWRTTMLWFGGFTIIALIIWLIISKDFSTEDSNNSNEIEENYSYRDALKTKFIYFFSIGFGGFLFLYVMSLVSLPNKISKYTGVEFSSELMILAITIGGIIGTLFSISISKISFRRKPFLIVHGILMIGFMALGLNMVTTNVTVSYICFVFSGIVMFSQYSVYLNIPYELKGVTPKKLTIMFGLFWAFGYTVYTIFNFVWSLILQNLGWNISILFYLAVSCVYILFIFTFPETNPKK